MRIVNVTPFYSPSIGGVEIIVQDTVEELVRGGDDVHVVTTMYDNYRNRIAPEGISVENGVVVHRLKPLFGWLGYATVMRRLKETLRSIKPDVVHCHNLHPHLFQATKWKKGLGYELVAQLHNPGATGIDHYSARFIYPTVIKYLAVIQNKIDAFIAETALEKRWLMTIGIESKRMYRVNYPCVKSSFIGYKPKSPYRFLYGNRYVVLYVGRIDRRKGIHTLIKAFATVIEQVDNSILVIAGPKNERYFRYLQRVSKAFNGAIVFKGPVLGQRKLDYMGSCTLFASPSVRDDHPITLIEAQALGRPVISTRVGSIPEIVKNGETGLLVKPENPKELAKAIKWFILHKNEREAMGIRARQWIKEKFLLEANVGKLKKLYGQL